MMLYLWLVSYFKRFFSQYMPVTMNRHVEELRSFLRGELPTCHLRIYLCQLHLVLDVHRVMTDTEHLVRCHYLIYEGWDACHFPSKVIDWHGFPKGVFTIPMSMVSKIVEEVE
jgi:hypothetical protein